MNYEDKYIKYKIKYNLLKNNINFDKNTEKLKKNNIAYYKNKINIMKAGTKDYDEEINEDEVKIYTKNLSEPWFSLINLGLKTVEGRLKKGDFEKMKINDIIEWTNDEFEKRQFKTKINEIKYYSTFEEYLINEGLKNCLPGIEKYGINHGLSVYYKYYKKEDEVKYGIVSIKLEFI
jgi:ASC-1-like (ASCH) protein